MGEIFFLETLMGLSQNAEKYTFTKVCKGYLGLIKQKM